jgi:hypothetical protein
MIEVKKGMVPQSRSELACLAAAKLGLNAVVLKQVVFFLTAAVRALQTADQQYGHTNSDKDGEDICIDL